MTRTETRIEALRDAAARSPEYAEILPFFIAIQEYLNGREGETGITAVPAASLQGRLKDGFPLLAPTDLRVDRDRAVAFLSGLAEVLQTNGKAADEQIEKLRDALQAGGIDPAGIYAAIVEHRREPIEQAAEEVGIQAPLIEFLFELPLKAALEAFSAGCEAADLAGWQEGFCPICGSRPLMAEISGEEGKRLLFCSTCSFKWPFRRIKCPACGNEETDKQSYFTVDEGAVRVDLCTACNGYIKTRDTRKGGGDDPLDVVDILTIHLDLLAAKEGYTKGNER